MIIRAVLNAVNQFSWNSTVKKYSFLFFLDKCATYASTEASNICYVEQWKSTSLGSNPLHIPSVMIWADLFKGHLIGPFFIDCRIDTDPYIQILRDEIIPEVQRRGLMQTWHLQQDGAPPHTAMRTREFLNEIFPNKWVGKFGPIPLPARSPDLTSPDKCFVGNHKAKP